MFKFSFPNLIINKPTFTKILTAKLFHKPSVFKQFSVIERMKLKEKIQMVNVSEKETSRDLWGDMIYVSLEKESINKFFDNIKIVSSGDIILALKDINKILSLLYNKNNKAVEILYEYIQDKEIQLDAMSYYYLIMSSIHFKKINLAFHYFFQANMFNIPQNLTVIIALLKEIEKVEKKEIKRNFMTLIKNHIDTFYNSSEIQE
jgi:hypothetical protein